MLPTIAKTAGHGREAVQESLAGAVLSARMKLLKHHSFSDGLNTAMCSVAMTSESAVQSSYRKKP